MISRKYDWLKFREKTFLISSYLDIFVIILLFQCEYNTAGGIVLGLVIISAFANAFDIIKMRNDLGLI